MRTLFLFSVSAFLLVSCGNHVNEQYIKTTDSLLKVAERISATVDAYESDTAENRYDKIKSDVDFIGQNLTTLPKGEASVKISEYANCSKGFKRFYKNIFKIKTDNNLSLKQLENLKKDLQGGKLSKDEASLYMLEEEKALNENYNKMNEAVAKYNSLCSETTKYNAFISHVTDSLKKLKNIQ